MKTKTIGQLGYEQNLPKGNRITHAEQIKAADWCARLDHLVNPTDCDNSTAIMRSTWLSIGAFRAFEWLDKNGFEVRKK